jgi:hypothetical protein
MKKFSTLIFCIGIISFFASSCTQAVFKKRKACRGNGSWYGNRNLGYEMHLKKKKSNTFYVQSEEKIKQ